MKRGGLLLIALLLALLGAGYRYDSSIYPIRHRRYGIASFPRTASVVRLPGGGAIHARREHDHAPPRRDALVRAFDRLGRGPGRASRARLRGVKPPDPGPRMELNGTLEIRR